MRCLVTGAWEAIEDFISWGESMIRSQCLSPGEQDSSSQVWACMCVGGGSHIGIADGEDCRPALGSGAPKM